jgi:hypothetical protein
MGNRVYLADVREKLVPQPLTARRATHQAGNIHKLQLRRYGLR